MYLLFVFSSLLKHCLISSFHLLNFIFFGRGKEFSYICSIKENFLKLIM